MPCAHRILHLNVFTNKSLTQRFRGKHHLGESIPFNFFSHLRTSLSRRKLSIRGLSRRARNQTISLSDLYSLGKRAWDMRAIRRYVITFLSLSPSPFRSVNSHRRTPRADYKKRSEMITLKGVQLFINGKQHSGALYPLLAFLQKAQTFIYLFFRID